MQTTTIEKTVIQDDYLVLVELHNRWRHLIDNLGKMPRDDAKEFQALADWAFKSRMISRRTDIKLWVENKIATKPFQVRPKKDKWKSSENNKYLWTLLMNGMEQIEQDL